MAKDEQKYKRTVIRTEQTLLPTHNNIADGLKGLFRS